MSKENTPTSSPFLPTQPMILGWFGTWAGLSGLLGSHMIDLGWREYTPFYIVASLVLGGGIAGWMLRKPIRNSVQEKRFIKAAFLGTAAALIALELGVTFTILALPDEGMKPLLLTAWLVAPLMRLPVLLIAGPLSGIGLVVAAQSSQWFAARI